MRGNSVKTFKLILEVRFLTIVVMISGVHHRLIHGDGYSC